MIWQGNKSEKARRFSAQATEDRQALHLEAQLDQHIADIAKILNRCLGFLDELGLSQAGAHLGAAINKVRFLALPVLIPRKAAPCSENYSPLIPR